jgi:hypothetical protein
MPSDVSHLLAPGPGRRECIITRTLKVAPPDVAAAFWSALGDRSVSNNKIVLAFAKSGLLDVSNTTVRTHRIGVCGCDR